MWNNILHGIMLLKEYILHCIVFNLVNTCCMPGYKSYLLQIYEIMYDLHKLKYKNVALKKELISRNFTYINDY